MKITLEDAYNLLKKALPYPEQIEILRTSPDEDKIYFQWRNIIYRWVLSTGEVMASTGMILEGDNTSMLIKHSIKCHQAYGISSILSTLTYKDSILITKMSVFYNEILAERIITPAQKRDIDEYMIKHLIALKA